MFKKNDVIEVEVTGTAYGGRGIGRLGEGFVVFVEGAVPGDKVTALVTRKKSNYAEAKTVGIISPSPDRVEPVCPLFGQCGGCTWQNLSYEAQVRCKQEISLGSLEHIGKNSDFQKYPIIQSPEVWRYRNKMDFTFGPGPNGEIFLGMHKKGSFSEIVDLEKCYICPEDFEVVARIIKDYGKSKKLAAYNSRNHQGLLRHLIIREGKNTGELAVIFLTSSEDFPDINALHNELKSALPNLKTFIWGINSGVSDAPNIDKVAALFGEEYYLEKLAHLNLQVSPFSFMQTNTKGAEKLYGVVRDFLEAKSGEVILDAYCGSGSIGLFIAQEDNKILGIDIVESSIKDAQRNAALNGIKNSTFLAGDMKLMLPVMLENINAKISRVIVDPPRGGMDNKSLKYLININAPLIVYVSCNPTTLARDLQVLSEAGYKAVKAQPVDMFPHTYHIEMVVQFVK